MLRLFYVALCATLSFSALSYEPLSKLPETSRAALSVTQLSDSKSLINTNNHDQYFPPASTLKVVTALAAKLELGDSYRFNTFLEQSGNDLIIRFNGDPTLSTKDLKQLFSQAKQQGITHIRGDVWLDNSAFSGYNKAVGWPWDILGVCYSAPSTAITLDNNCVQASLSSQSNGGTRSFVPEHQPIYVTTSARSVTKAQQEESLCELELIPSPDNHYLLQGCMVKREKPLPLKFAVQNPELYSSRNVYSILRSLRIQFDGEVKVGTPPQKQSNVITSHQSEPLPKLLDVMLKRSRNLIADNLTKTLGRHYYNQAGSFINGTEAIKQILLEKTGIDITQTPLADGSGLSRNNLFKVSDMEKILRYIWDNDQQLQLIKLMPSSGESGTLKYRRSMRQDPVKGSLIAKSGSVYGAKNMAGYGLDSNGKPSTVFVQFVADYHPVKPKTSKPVMTPITHFETLFYKDIVQFSQLAK